MGLRGPTAKPIELRAIEGSDHRVVAMPTTGEAATPPAGMNDDERAVWRDVAATFPGSFFKSADRHHLAAYCNAVVLWQKARVEVETNGPMIWTKFGDKPSPWLRVMKQAHAQMVQLGDRLGIGPGRRTQSPELTDASKRKSLLYGNAQTK